LLKKGKKQNEQQQLDQKVQRQISELTAKTKAQEKELAAATQRHTQELEQRILTKHLDNFEIFHRESWTRGMNIVLIIGVVILGVLVYSLDYEIWELLAS